MILGSNPLYVFYRLTCWWFMLITSCHQFLSILNDQWSNFDNGLTYGFGDCICIISFHQFPGCDWQHLPISKYHNLVIIPKTAIEHLTVVRNGSFWDHMVNGVSEGVDACVKVSLNAHGHLGASCNWKTACYIDNIDSPCRKVLTKMELRPIFEKLIWEIRYFRAINLCNKTEWYES